MALTAGSLASALGIPVADADDDDDPGLVEGARLLSIAESLVDAYRRDPDDEMGCPESIRDEAVIRTAGHVRQGRSGFGAVEGRFKISSAQFDLQPLARSAVRQSGAAALLAPWVRRTG